MNTDRWYTCGSIVVAVEKAVLCDHLAVVLQEQDPQLTIGPRGDCFVLHSGGEEIGALHALSLGRGQTRVRELMRHPFAHKPEDLETEGCPPDEAAAWSWRWSVLTTLTQAAVERVARLLPGKRTTRKLGTQGGTMDRVREAQGLIREGMSKTKACKRVGIDTRTYDRYADVPDD